MAYNLIKKGGLLMERIKIDEKKRSALEKAISSSRGSMARISGATGIPKSQLSKYCSGKTKSISLEVWKAVLPYIETSLELDKDDLLAKSENHLTVPLIKIFEQLDPETASSVFRDAEQCLREQETDYFVRLNSKEIAKLERVGVFPKFTPFENDVSCSPMGLCWLVNMQILVKPKIYFMTPLLLRELLDSVPDFSYARELCVNQFQVVPHDRSVTYWQWAFYLNGSPPPWYLAELEAGNMPVANGFSFPPRSRLPFQIDKLCSFNVVFSGDDITSLKSGKTMVFEFPRG
jgi:transcriptional regulator with XRE-family HTH domain